MLTASSLPPNTNGVKLHYKIALGFGFFTLFFTGQGVHILAVPYYQMTLGVDPFLLSLVMTLPMLFGSAVGPLAGHLSDNLKSRWGRRSPFIFTAALVLGLCYGLLWMVPPHWPEATQLLYFAAFGTLFYLATAFYTVPLNGLAYELSDNAGERTQAIGFATYFLKSGSLLYQWVFPLAQLAVFGSVYLGIRYIGWGMGVVVFALCGMLPALIIRENVSASQYLSTRVSFIDSLRSVIDNPSMKLLLLLVLLQMGGSAFAATLDYYLLVYYVHAGNIAEGAIWKATLSTSYALVSIACVPLVLKLSTVQGKLGALQVIYLINACGGLAKWFIFVPDARWIIITDALLCGAVWTAMVILIPSMVSDLSHQDQQAGKGAHAGMYASIYNWVLSISSVLALMFSGLSLNLLGFNAHAGAAQAPESLQYMRIILAGGTVLFSLLPLWILYYYRQHKPGVLAALQQR